MKSAFDHTLFPLICIQADTPVTML